MRKLSSLIVGAALAGGCAAPGPTPDPEPATEMIRVPVGTTTATAANVESVKPTVTTIAKPLNTVWLLMASVYDSLKVPLTTLDPTTHRIGNGALEVRRRLGNTPVREYLNCGNTQGALNADSYEIKMSVMSKLIAAPSGGTEITTTVQAMGRPIATSGDFLRCSSTGSLEIRLGEIAKALAAR